LNDNICEICGSNKKVQRYSKTNQYLCNKHYKQIYRHGKIIEKHRLTSNDIIEYTDLGYAEIILRSNDGNEIARSQIDIEDVTIVKQYKWHLSNNGYVTSSFPDIYLHRLIMYAPNNRRVDHINHNTLNNRKYNLRICSAQENVMNSKISKNNTSSVTGVNYRKDRNKWRAYIMFNRKQINLGFYDNFYDAVKARKEAEIKYFGEFAPFNTKEEYL
jgi:predicted MarR family transcription regulator